MDQPVVPAGIRVTSRDSDRCVRWFEEVQSYLPVKCEALLDIGCGRAIVDIILFKHYEVGGQNPQIHLLDAAEGRLKNGKGDAGYKSDMQPWASVADAGRILSANKVDSVLWGVPPDFDLYKQKFDLILSIRSWGHHYPLAAYAELVAATVKPGGIVVVDLRIERADVGSLIELGFQTLAAWPSGRKATRTVFQRGARP